MTNLKFIKSQLEVFSQGLGGMPSIETLHDSCRKGSYHSGDNRILVRDIDDFLTIAHEWGHAVGLKVKDSNEFVQFLRAAHKTPMCAELLELENIKVEKVDDLSPEFLKQHKSVEYFLRDCELWANAFAQAFFNWLTPCSDWTALDMPRDFMDTETSECVVAIERGGYWPKAEFLEHEIERYVVGVIKAKAAKNV